MNVSPFYFNYTIALQRPTITKDASGGIVRDWTIIPQSDIVASIQPMKLSEQQFWETRNLEVDYKIYVESDPSFKRGDRAVVREDGRIFSVEGVQDYAGFQRLYMILAKELLD